MKAAFVFITSLVASSCFAAPAGETAQMLERADAPTPAGASGAGEAVGLAVDVITAGIDLVKGILDQVHQDKLVRVTLSFSRMLPIIILSTL